MSENTISNEYAIDEDIRDLIEFCNNNGIKTLGSCSGTLKDHKDSSPWGQLYIKDSEIARKIAAVIIEKGICRTDLLCKPTEERKLYDNTISYASINFIFKNLDNEILPKIEEVIHQVVSREIEPNGETMNKINQIFDFLNSIDRQIDSSYIVNAPGFAGKLTFETYNITSRKRVDKECVVERLVKTTGKKRNEDPYYIGIVLDGNENLSDILGKAKEAIRKAPKISKRKEERKDRKREKMERETYAKKVTSLQEIGRNSQLFSEQLSTLINTNDVADSVEDKLIENKTDIVVEPWENL